MYSWFEKDCSTIRILTPGTITYTDDAQFSPDVVAMMKQSTSDFQAETKHRTVNADRKFEEFCIPPRVTF